MRSSRQWECRDSHRRHRCRPGGGADAVKQVPGSEPGGQEGARRMTNGLVGLSAGQSVAGTLVAQASAAPSLRVYLPLLLLFVLALAFAVFSVALGRSEEHTSELQSRFDLVCRLLLEKKKRNNAY